MYILRIEPINLIQSIVASFPADVPAEQLTRRRRTRTATLKPATWAPLRRRLVPQLLKRAARIAWPFRSTRNSIRIAATLASCLDSTDEIPFAKFNTAVPQDVVGR